MPVDLGTQREAQAAMLSEMAKVTVACDQREIVVETGLRDQAVCQPGFETMGVETGAEDAGAFPITVNQVEHGNGE